VNKVSHTFSNLFCHLDLVYKYQHPNLCMLIAHSIDGPSRCLLQVQSVSHQSTKWSKGGTGTGTTGTAPQCECDTAAPPSRGVARGVAKDPTDDAAELDVLF
jgi:hypothetical protein